MTGTPRTARRSDAGPLDLPTLPAESRIKGFGRETGGASRRVGDRRPHRIKGRSQHQAEPAAGQSVQRYYDQGVGRFLSVDPVTANADTGAMFNRYNYANNNPYMFTDPDGRAPESAGRAIDHDIRAMSRGEMSPEEFTERQQARGAGAVAGVAAVACMVNCGAVLGTAGTVLKTKTARSVFFAVMSFISRQGDDLVKVGLRVQKQAVEQVRKSTDNAVQGTKQERKGKPPEPPKPPQPPKPPKEPKP